MMMTIGEKMKHNDRCLRALVLQNNTRGVGRNAPPSHMLNVEHRKTTKSVSSQRFDQARIRSHTNKNKRKRTTFQNLCMLPLYPPEVDDNCGEN